VAWSGGGHVLKCSTGLTMRCSTGSFRTGPPGARGGRAKEIEGLDALAGTTRRARRPDIVSPGL
jgi:hypothetical protein